MFGYITANTDKLTKEEIEKYRSCYCGLCRTLGNRHGTISRATLTYDMTFLVLLLSALYKTESKVDTARCGIHPLKPHIFLQNEITDYAADMNVTLAYYNFMDDWIDDGKVLSLMEAKLFQKENKRIEEQYPRQCTAISACLAELSGIEKNGELNPDIPANCFGNLMGEIFVRQEDEFSERLREFGRSLGKFIYIMDACLDLKADIKKERYNPLITTPSISFRSILNSLMADCTEKYNQLPITTDKALLENILYSGVWAKYEASNKKQKEKKTK